VIPLFCILDTNEKRIYNCKGVIIKRMESIMFLNLLNDYRISMLIGVIFSFVLTYSLTSVLKEKLPTDRGKEFAHDGQAAKGKPQGAGIIFVLVFIAACLLFGKVSLENIIFLLLTGLCMVAGYLDDSASLPWGRVKKGLLDLALSVGVAIDYIYFNGSDISFRILKGYSLHIHPVLMAVIIIALVWGSINVTNCADGVDGLSGSLSIITFITIYRMYMLDGTENINGYFPLFFVVCLMAYLWFNAYPSKLMMGDAGSRAMGFMIAICVLKTGSLFAYAIIAIVLILDGGLGLLKVSLIKAFKIHIMKNIRTPLHDQVRKNMGWENMHCVFRFAIIQAVINIAYILLVSAL